MNADKLINSSHKIQDKWLGNYDQNTFGNEIADNDIGYFLTWDIDELIEERIEDTSEQYEVLKNLNNKELKKIKKSSMLTYQEIEDLKKDIIEDRLMNLECEYIFYSSRECEGEEVFAVFTGAIDNPGSVVPSLFGIFRNLEDAKKSLISTGRYIDEYQKHHF